MSSPSMEVGPGFLAFAVFFFLAIALWLLMRNMFRRMRRMNLAERSQQARRREEGTPSSGRGGSTTGESGARRDRPEEGERRGDEV